MADSSFVSDNLMTDDEETVARSGIFTTDGQSSIATRGPWTNPSIPQDIDDQQSLVSGIEDASMLDDTVYRGLTGPDGESFLGGYSLDDSTTDYGNYTSPYDPPPAAAVATRKVIDSNQRSTSGKSTEDTVFSSTYSRLVNSFLFAAGSSRKQNSSGDDSNSAGRGTPKTLSPKDSHDVQGFEDDDEERSAPRTPPPNTSAGNKKSKKSASTVPSTGSSSLPPYVCGLSLPRVICIILVIILAAVAVAVGAALYSSKSSSPGENDFQNALFPTASPSSSNDTTKPPFTTPTATETGSPSNTHAPVTVALNPTMLPSSAPTPVGFCGGDDDEATFTLFNEERNCAWFR